MVCVAVCAVIRACFKNVLDGSKPNENQVQLVPVPWTRVSPGDFMLKFCLEEGVSDAKGLEGKQLKQSLTISIHFPYSKRTKAGGPWIVVCTHSGTKVTQQNQLFPSWGWSRLLLQDSRGTHLLRQEWRTILGGTRWPGRMSLQGCSGVYTPTNSHQPGEDTPASPFPSASTQHGRQQLSVMSHCSIGVGEDARGCFRRWEKGVLLPYISHKGMCSPIGYCFYAIWV